MRIRLDIAYDGTHFRGWARQPALRTVQGTLEAALERILGGTATLVVAGRTDAGVHATGQVAHIDLDPGQILRLRRSRVSAAPAAHNSSSSLAEEASERRVAGSVDEAGGVVRSAEPSPPAAVVSSPAAAVASAAATDSAPDGDSAPQAAHSSSTSAAEEASERRVAGSVDGSGGVMRPADASPAAAHPLSTDNDPSLAAAAAKLAARIRGVLGAYSDVAVQRTSVAPAGFDARFSAVWRRYSYRIADDITGYDPLERHRTATVRAQLDEQAMDAAARSLIGLHDFAAYCKPREMATTIRTLLEFGWQRDADGLLIANVKADAFCHSMVRAMVGACVAVGQGRLDVEDLADIRDEGERTSDFTVIAARGLTLTEVGYPTDDLLAGRAEQTRARRDLG